MQNAYSNEKDIDIPLDKDKGPDIRASLRQGEERMKEVITDVEQKLKHGQEQLRHVASDVDQQLHEKPWPIVAGVAIGCVLLGFIMGISKRN